jgi:hypothetical protein
LGEIDTVPAINMLKSHLDAIEKTLVTQSGIQNITGHTLHKGTPREVFIKEFLENHLPETVSIGTGEIIDANSQPGQQRNQYDIVIYKNSYTKLDFGGGISGFLIESVITTIEVKSTLTEADLKQSIKAARKCKQLKPNTVSIFRTGYIPPKPINFLVAYNGPASMDTVYGWIPKIYQSEGITSSNLPIESNQRIQQASPAIDGVFVLEKGFLYYDNIPMGFAIEEDRKTNPNLKWLFADSKTGNLLLLFLFLQGATQNVQGKWLNPRPYLSNFQVQGLKLGTAKQD